MQVEVQELQVTTALSSATSRFGLTVQGAPAKGNVAFPAGQTGQRKWLSFGLFSLSGILGWKTLTALTLRSAG